MYERETLQHHRKQGCSNVTNVHEIKKASKGESFNCFYLNWIGESYGSH